MNSKNAGARAAHMPCVSLHADDGIDPRTPRKPVRTNRTNRKDLQLCDQVVRALSLALSADCSDPLLRELVVERADAAPNVSRLRVTVRAPFARDAQALARVVDQLARASGFLRSEVAASIHRKRAPELVFVVMPGEGNDD